MAPVLHKGGPAFGCSLVVKRSVLGWQMSKNGIRSLIIALAIGLIFWVGVAVEIMHFTGVFNG